MGSAATASRCSASWTERSVPLGRYWRSSPLVFSLLPHCQGECGSQKYTGARMPVQLGAQLAATLHEQRVRGVEGIDDDPACHRRAIE